MNQEILIYPFETLKLVNKDLVFSKTYIFHDQIKSRVKVSSNFEVNCKSR